LRLFAALALSSNCMEDLMSELEMKNEAEADEFTEELNDEALDREEVKLLCAVTSCRAAD